MPGQRLRSKPAEVLTLFVGAICALLVAFGVNLTDKQIAAILGVVSFVPLVVTTIVDTIRSARAEHGRYTIGDALIAAVAVIFIIWLAGYVLD